MNGAWSQRFQRLVNYFKSGIGQRLISIGVLLTSGVVLLTALMLEPSPLGHSTHTQLGLLPCTFYTLTGFPCPMCGATTTFALMAEGQWIRGFVNQPFAAVLFLMTVTAWFVALLEVVAPRQRWHRIGSTLGNREAMLLMLFLGIMLISWFYKIALVRAF